MSSWRLPLQKGKISWAEYQKMYREMMQISYRQHRETWQAILNKDEVVQRRQIKRKAIFAFLATLR
jgi:hypothetical protein